MGKYEQMLGAVSTGFSNNPTVINPDNTPYLLPALANPINTLRS